MAKNQTRAGIPVIEPLLNLIIGTRNERFVKKYTRNADDIGKLEVATRQLSDAQLRGKLTEFRTRIDQGAKPESLLVEAFSVAREAMDRAVGIRNIFNPKFAEQFDAGRLPSSARAIYEQLKGELGRMQPFEPAGEFQGCEGPVSPYLKLDIPPALYDAVRELYPQSKPPFRARPFDVQLIGGMVLFGGKIAEMRTGEGKTIVGPLACYLAAMEGLKVHVVTVNDYLVQRDRDWTFPYFHALGMTVGAIHPMHMQPEHLKREMYGCDVVYGTTAEFGFDYLRDNMKRSADQQVQKVRELAIVDEVDSILIDEARTPLIISGAAHEDAPRYDMADKLARHLVQRQSPWQAADDQVQHCKKRIKGLEGDIRNLRDKSNAPALEAELKAARAELPMAEAARSKHVQYYEIELDRKQAHLTHDGIAEAQRVAGMGSFYVGENMDLPHLLGQAVRAHVVYQRDRDYIVAPSENPQTGRQEPSIIIVDVNTGRPMVGRQWSDGLHQAVEAKEAVPVRQETQTVATITIQNFFKMYKRLAGMTGTADTEAQEFHDIYGLDVVSIPTNLPVARKDHTDLMFVVGKDKWGFIVDEVKQFHDVGRPVLVGTTSVEKSEMLSKMLASKHGLKHEVLNAKQHDRESVMIESAGQLGAVMIATNMAGRGTDIKLGKITRETLLDHWLRRGIASRELSTTATTEQLRENVYRKIASKELDLPKHEVEQMNFADIELRLLRSWAMRFTLESQKKVDSLGAEQLRALIEPTGRCLLHKLDWFETLEQMGGLHVIGTERHESRRIDNQLRGRSGRQGDKGSSRFFVSLDDDLMKMFAGEKTMKILSTIGMKEGDALESPMLSKSIERAQRKVEERNFQVRKNILEYDEVMEHQRRSFYGLRQRVIEGRDVRGLIFGYIEESVRDASGEYLAKEYPSVCAAEYVRQTLDISVFADRLRGLDLNEMDKRIRQDAKDEARQMIDVTLGEYIPDASSEFEVDFDAEGLSRWAKSHFNAELDAAEIRGKGAGGRKAVRDALLEAAESRIDAADLSGLARFVESDYGASELSRWADNKFGIKVEPAKILAAMADNKPGSVEALIIEQARELYSKHEVEYPVTFTMSGVKSMMRQNPPAAMEMLMKAANERYGLNWTPQDVIKNTPQVAEQKLIEASRAFVASGVVEKRISEAMGISDPEKLGEWFQTTLKVEGPANLKRLSGEERENAIRSKVEAALRPELLFFERTMMLEVLDDLWKNHLYSMDQLRDSIGYRSFSQQDPRIEFKREGSKIFSGMWEQVRDRVTDMIFKLQLVPQFQAPVMQQPAPRIPAPGVASGPGSVMTLPLGPSGVIGPGAEGASGGGRSSELYYADPSASKSPSGGPAARGAPTDAATPSAPAPARADPYYVPPSAAPASDRAQRDLDAAQRAGSDPNAKPAPVVNKGDKLGRNDACPMGTGRKYKRCCNRLDGTCNGQGMHMAAGPETDD
jgi:preprotein translocase subunit SecA